MSETWGDAEIASLQAMVQSITDDRNRLLEENEHLKAEIREARNEAAVVRRAYLHERGRANAAARALGDLGALEASAAFDEMAYRGPAERYATASESEESKP